MKFFKPLKEDFCLFIPTCRRPNRQITATRLLQASIPFNVVVQGREATAYDYFREQGVPVIVLPWWVCDLSDTWQWLLENTPTRYFMCMDDDLYLFRREPDSVKLHIASDEDIKQMFDTLYGWMKEGVVHVGVSMREGNNRYPDPYYENMRMCRATGYDSEVVRSLGVKFNRVICRADFHMTLELLKRGYKNRVLFEFATNQPGSNTDGGCSSYRSDEVLEENAILLAKMHHPYVKVVEKVTKTAWNSRPRKDVIVYWKKAFRDSQKNQNDSH